MVKEQNPPPSRSGKGPDSWQAAVFYWLTSHRQTRYFRTNVQALIFTVLVQAVVKMFFIVMEGIGWTFLWDETGYLIFSTSAAIGLGLVAVYTLNKDIPHRYLRRIGVTRENCLSIGVVFCFRPPCGLLSCIAPEGRTPPLRLAH